MDKRKGSTHARSRGRVKGQSRHPGSSRRKGRPMTTGRGRNGRSGTRHAKKVNRARKRRNKILFIMIIILLIMILAAGAVFFKRYGSSNEEADKEQYYGIENSDDLALIINNEVVKKEESSAESSSDSSADSVIPGKVFDGQYYVAYQVLRDKINSRFYWDANERVLLYTLPDGNISVSENSSEYTAVNETKSEDYVILKTDGDIAYIALPFIQEYTNMEYSVEQEPNRAIITSKWGEIETAEVKKDTQVRYLGGVKSPILTEVKKSDKVTVLEDEDDWMKVATADGYVGYIKTKFLKNQKKEKISRDFTEPVYSNMTEDHSINMAWHNVTNAAANNAVQQVLASTSGLTTIAPTWFSLADTEGNISSIADADYVNYAHTAGLEVWAVFRDFHGGTNSYDETYETLRYTSKRAKLEDQVVAAAVAAGVDGINLDFELISSKCGVHYVQLVRELSVKCHQNNLVFSVDNYVPQSYNSHYDLKEQGIVADYVVIMAYDEHTEGSYEAGSVASISYLQDGIEKTLKKVSADKVIAGIPFFTRLWFETAKSPEQLSEEASTEAASYPNKVSSKALGMEEAAQSVVNAGATAQWDEKTQQNYAKWSADGGTYRIWLEDAQSLEAKLKVIQGNKLAGVAEWSLGREESSVWKLISQYVN